MTGLLKCLKENEEYWDWKEKVKELIKKKPEMAKEVLKIQEGIIGPKDKIVNSVKYCTESRWDSDCEQNIGRPKWSLETLGDWVRKGVGGQVIHQRLKQ